MKEKLLEKMVLLMADALIKAREITSTADTKTIDRVIDEYGIIIKDLKKARKLWK